MDGIRKRVCKACDRCRLKKSKCDGSSPCSRCKADNSICVFGERKKSHDKVYPKGYVEMLEQQQSQLVSGMQELYRRLEKAKAWEGSKLEETNGNPLTHDILAALNLLEPKSEGGREMETFEEDCQKLQSKLLADGSGYVRRRGSFSSDSDHSQHGHARSGSYHSTPVLPKPSLFQENFSFPGSNPSPLSQSPAPQPMAQPQPSPQQQAKPAQFASVPLSNDPGLYAPDWAQALAERNDPSQCMRLSFPAQLPELDDGAINGLDMSQWDQSPAQYDATYSQFTAYPDAMFMGSMNTMQTVGDMPQMDGMDLDFRQFVQPQDVLS